MQNKITNTITVVLVASYVLTNAQVSNIDNYFEREPLIEQKADSLKLPATKSCLNYQSLQFYNSYETMQEDREANTQKTRTEMLKLNTDSISKNQQKK